MPQLKIGVTLWSLGPYRTLDEFKQKLDLAAETGARAVQVWCVDYSASLPCALDPDRCTGPQRRDAAKAVESRGLAISGWCAQLAGPTQFGGFGEKEGLEERIHKTQRAVELAVELGAPIVTTHVGEIPEEPGRPDYGIYLSSVGQVVRHAEKIGGIFAMETGQESAACLRRFIEDLASPAARCNYDPANMLGYGTVEGVTTLGPTIVHAHAKDHNPTTGRATVGQGDVPWREYLAAMASIGYTGWHAIEDETGVGVVESIKAGVRFLQQF